VRILALSGSLRRGSHNTLLLRAAAELAAPGDEVVLWTGIGELPHFSEDADVEPAPAPVAAFRAAVLAADAVLISTPEYNHSIPGTLKNALDWASRPIATNAFRDKPVAVIGASAGIFGAVWAQAELRKVLAAMGARVSDVELGVGQAETRFDDEGRLVDDGARDQLRVVLGTLAASASPVLAAA
jgi:chromate reductase